METVLDSTLLTVAVIVVIASILALIRAQKRDRCLTHFNDFHVTLAEKAGDVTWGELDVRTSGMEIYYPSARQSREGFWKQSFLFYKEQYESMDGIYRCTTGLSQEKLEDRRKHLERTADPGIFRRSYRKIRNWVGMVRDALVEAISLLIGAAKSKGKPAAVLTKDEERMSSLSSELIGHAGNAYDPLLEKHLFTRVIIDVTRQGKTRNYCGYLADYTDKFLEIVDAGVNAEEGSFRSQVCGLHDHSVDGLVADVDSGFLIIKNESNTMMLLEELRAGDAVVAIGAVIPGGFVAQFRLGAGIDIDAIEIVITTAFRVDMLVPRSHALVRHGVSGLSKEELGDIHGNDKSGFSSAVEFFKPGS